MSGAFTVGQRDSARESILRKARADSRVVAAAVVGSEAIGNADRWSDLDLAFGLAPGISPERILDEWSPALSREFDAVPLFDVRQKASLYRVFLLPGGLQVDLSFTPGSVPRYGPAFRLLFGDQVTNEPDPGRPASEIFGHGVHHAVRARLSIERGRLLQAEFWVSGLRDEALSLACRQRGLETGHGRGLDQLPPELRGGASDCLVLSLERKELLRALDCSVKLLLQAAVDLPVIRNKLTPQLIDLSSTEWA